MSEANDNFKILTAIKDIDASMSRMDAERDLIKGVKDTLLEDVLIEKKVLNKLIKAYHKQNFGEEVTLHQEFEELYKEVVG